MYQSAVRNTYNNIPILVNKKVIKTEKRIDTYKSFCISFYYVLWYIRAYAANLCKNIFFKWFAQNAQINLANVYIFIEGTTK